MRLPSFLLLIVLNPISILARSIHGHRHQHSPRVTSDQPKHDHTQNHPHKNAHVRFTKDKTSASPGYKHRHVHFRRSKISHLSPEEEVAIHLKPISKGFTHVAKTRNRGQHKEEELNVSSGEMTEDTIMQVLNKTQEREEKNSLILEKYVKNGIGGGDVVVGVVAGLMVAGAFVV